MNLGNISFGQAPNLFNYQAVVRDASGNIKANTNVNAQINIMQGSATGPIVFAETFAPQTNGFGLINLEIGSGTLVSGDITTIDWAAGPYFLKITIDGIDFGAFQLLSVPYSLYAAKAGNVFSGSYNDLTDRPELFNGSYFSLTNKPTVENQGYHSIATGYRALYNNTGNNNIATGFESLEANTSGYNNTAYGVYSLNKNETGHNNTAIGINSLINNISGYCNTAAGAATLTNNTDGNYNTATGYAALQYNIHGGYNTAFGYFALYHHASGSRNTAIGSEALNNDTSGTYNVAIGSGALHDNLSGRFNTAAGSSSLYHNTTGNYNTVIGYSSDVASGNLTNATAIGYDAEATASNTVMIGNTNVDYVYTYGDFTELSDRRLKENIVYNNDLGLDFIMKLKTASYNFKDNESKHRRDGLIAQDVEQALKELGVEFSGLSVADNPEKTMGLAYSDFVLPLINAVQEQQKQIEAQQKLIDDLKQLVEKLTKQ